jgi:hypothetical protein
MTIRWVTDGRLKRSDCCTRWDGDGYKDVILAEDYDKAVSRIKDLVLENAALRHDLSKSMANHAADINASQSDASDEPPR